MSSVEITFYKRWSSVFLRADYPYSLLGYLNKYEFTTIINSLNVAIKPPKIMMAANLLFALSWIAMAATIAILLGALQGTNSFGLKFYIILGCAVALLVTQSLLHGRAVSQVLSAVNKELKQINEFYSGDMGRALKFNIRLLKHLQFDPKAGVEWRICFDLQSPLVKLSEKEFVQAIAEENLNDSQYLPPNQAVIHLQERNNYSRIE
jgi:hypothetical protein